MTLKEFRQNKELTAAEISRYIGVNPAVLSRYENHKCDIKNMRLKNAVKLKRILGLINTRDLMQFSQGDKK